MIVELNLPMVKNPHFQCRGVGAVPGQETKMPHAVWRNQNKTKYRLCVPTSSSPPMSIPQEGSKSTAITGSFL